MALVPKILASYVDYKPLTGPGMVPGATAQTATAKLDSFISNVIALLSVVAIIYFALQIIFAGYAFMSAEGDKNKLEQARNRLTNGVLGLFITIIALSLASLIAWLFGFTPGEIFNLEGFFGKLGL